jgi:hypothetical protein
VAKVNFYDPEMDWLLNNPAGTVGRFLSRVGREIVLGARAQAGVKTGQLRASIRIQSHTRYALGQQIEVGSNVRHAYVHHEGSIPHIIVPKTAKVLRFSSRGRVVMTQRVAHPGNKANKYLTTPMEAVVRRL